MRKSVAQSAVWDKDPYTGREILRFPKFDLYNLHPYYDRQAFSSDGKMIAISSMNPSQEVLNDKATGFAIGHIHIVSFPEGETIHRIDDVPVPRHGGRFEFSKYGNFLITPLLGGKMGLFDLNSGQMKEIPVHGDLYSFSSNDQELIAVTLNDDGFWMSKLDKSGNKLSEEPLALNDEILSKSEISINHLGFNQGFGNIKLSPDGKRCMFVRRLYTEERQMRSKELYIAQLDGSPLQRIFGADYTENTNFAGSFHHAAWVPNGDKIIFHAPSSNFDRVTYQMYSVLTGEVKEMIPFFAGNGHHSITTSDESRIITDSYIGDLNGVVSLIDRGTGLITPLAGWKLEEHRVDGHPSLSPDENWILYDCNIDGGSEVRAVRVFDN